MSRPQLSQSHRSMRRSTFDSSHDGDGGGVTVPSGASHSNGRSTHTTAAARNNSREASAAAASASSDSSSRAASAASSSPSLESMQHAQPASAVSSSPDSSHDSRGERQTADSPSFELDASSSSSSAAQPASAKGKKKGKQKAQQHLLQPQLQMPTARQSSADSNASSSASAAADSAGPVASSTPLSRNNHHSRSASQLQSSATLDPSSPSPSPASAASASSSSSARPGRNASQRPAPPVAAYSVTGAHENGVAMPSTHGAKIPFADRVRKKTPQPQHQQQQQQQFLESPPPRFSAASPLDISPPAPAMSPAATVSAALQSRAKAAAPSRKERVAAAAAASSKADVSSSSIDPHDVDPPLPRSNAAAVRRGPPAAAPVSAWSKRAAAAPAPAPAAAPAMAYSAALQRAPGSRKSSISSDSSGESAASNSAAAASAAAAFPAFPSSSLPSAVHSCPPADPVCDLREFPSTPPRASPSSTASPARTRLLMSKQGLASIRNLISQPSAASKRGASKSGSSTPATQADLSQTTTPPTTVTPPSASPSAAALSSGNVSFAAAAPAAPAPSTSSAAAAAPAPSPPAAAVPAVSATRPAAKGAKNPPPTFAVSLMAAAATPSTAAAAPPTPSPAPSAPTPATAPPLIKSSSPTKAKTRPLLTSALAAVSQQQSDSKRSLQQQQHHHHSNSSPLSSSSRSDFVAPVFPIPSALSSPSAPMPSHHPTLMHVLSDPSSSAPMAHSSSSLSSSRAMTPYGGSSDAIVAHSSPDYSLRTSPRSSPPSAAQFTRSAPASPVKRRREARLSDIKQHRMQQTMHHAAEHAAGDDDNGAACSSDLKRSASSPTLSSSLSLLDRSSRFADAGFRSLNASFDSKRHSRAQDDTNHHHHHHHRQHRAQEEEDHSDQEEAEAEVEKTKQRLMGALSPPLRKHAQQPPSSAASASAAGGDDFASELDEYEDHHHRALDANYDEIESEVEHRDDEEEEEDGEIAATESEYAGCTSANRSIETSDVDSSRDFADEDTRLKRSSLRTPARHRARRSEQHRTQAVVDASTAGHASTTASSSSGDSSLSYTSTPASLSPADHSASNGAATATTAEPVEYSPLHYQFPEISRMLGPTQQEQAMRRAVSKRVGEAVWSLWPDAEVHLIGSCATNLFLPDSDIDLVIRNPPSKPKLSITDLYALGEHLTPMASSINIIPTASVPLIKIVDRATNYTVDLTLNVETGLYSTSYVIEQLELFPGLLHPLAIVLKQLLKAKNLNDLFSGGLPSYNLILMIVSFLQQHTVEAHEAQRIREAQQQQEQQQRTTIGLPPPLLASNGVPTRRASAAESASNGSALLSMSSSASSSSSAPATATCSPTIPLRTQLTKSSGELESGGGSALLTPELSLHCPPCTAGSASKSPSSAGSSAPLGVVIPPSPHVLDPLHPDLGEYLLAFLHLYGTTFPYAVLGISLRTGYFLKASRDWLHPHNPQLLALENPMDPSIDLGFKVFRMAEIRTLFQESYATLKAGKGFAATTTAPATTPTAAPAVTQAVVEPPMTRAPVVSHQQQQQSQSQPPQLPHHSHAPQLRSASETSMILNHVAAPVVVANGHGFIHPHPQPAGLLYHSPHPALASTPLYMPVAAPGVGGAHHYALVPSSQSAPHSTAHSPYLAQHAHGLGSAGPSTLYLPPSAARQAQAPQQQQQHSATYSRSGYSSSGSIPSASVSRGVSPCLSDSSASAVGLLPTPGSHGVVSRGSFNAASSSSSLSSSAASYPLQPQQLQAQQQPPPHPRPSHVNGKRSPFGAPTQPKQHSSKAARQKHKHLQQQQQQGQAQQPQQQQSQFAQKQSKRNSPPPPPRQFE